MSGSRAPVFAIGVASVALVVAVVAAFAVATRDDPSPGGPPAAAPPPDPSPVITARVPAPELARLRRDTLERVAGGVRVSDLDLRDALALGADDVITHVAGRPIASEGDVQAAIAAASAGDAEILYVELSRAGAPLLARWEIDGSLRAARRVPVRRFTGPRDPLLDTIVKIDDYRYEVPRSTLERVLANPTDFARGARIIPAIQGGAPEGLKLYAIRPSSIWAALGFANGDTIRAINGHEVTSVDNALYLYARLRDARELAVDITRRGRYELITITIK